MSKPGSAHHVRRGHVRSRDGTHPIDIAVGQAIRRARLIKGLSQKEVGNAIGCSFQAVQKYENGENRISASRLALVARVLETNVASLFIDVDGVRRRHLISSNASSTWAAALLNEALKLPPRARHAILTLARSWNAIEASKEKAATATAPPEPALPP